MNKPKLQTTPPASTADVRTGMTSADILHDFRDQLAYEQARFAEVATRNDHYMALAYAVRDRLLQRWIKTMHLLGLLVITGWCDFVVWFPLIHLQPTKPYGTQNQST